MDNLTPFMAEIVQFLGDYVPKVALAVLALIVGWMVIKSLVKLFGKAIEKKDVDVSLRKFLTGLFGGLLKVLLLLSVISMVGIETTSFIAVLAAAGFAIGMALQGSLSNFAGGVLILLFKPFRVGDYITSQGHSGTVNSIDILHTVLKTPDNVTIILPNGPVAANAVTNYTTEDLRRLDLAFGIGYDDDIPKAKDLMMKLIQEDDRTLKDPEPMIALAELADSSVNFTVRMWCKKEDYWALKWDMQERVKLKFDEENINIPYPQTDVHIHNN